MTEQRAQEMVNEREKAAREAFLQGYNCAQAIMVAFQDVIGIEPETALRLASSFGGGMGRMREVCGSVSGIFMVAGLLYGYSDSREKDGKRALYAIVQELAARYRAEAGSIICRELLGMAGVAEADNTDPEPGERTPEYYRKRPCEVKIGLAARILDEYMQEHPPGNGDKR